MPERWLFELAKEYGQSPGDVENWDPWITNRALKLMEAEGIKARREMPKPPRGARQK